MRLSANEPRVGDSAKTADSSPRRKQRGDPVQDDDQTQAPPSVGRERNRHFELPRVVREVTSESRELPADAEAADPSPSAETETP